MTLFVLSLLLEIVGFLLGASEHIPLILKIVSPTYLAATDGLQNIQQGTVLNQGKPGFNEISKLYLKTLEDKSLHVISFQATGDAGLKYSRGGLIDDIPVRVILSNEQNNMWDLARIKDRVSELKDKNLFQWGIGLFISGVLLQIVGYIIDRAGKK